MLSTSQNEFVKETEVKVYKLLEETPPNGKAFAQTVRHMLKREELWNNWKNEGCKGGNTHIEEILIEIAHYSIDIFITFLQNLNGPNRQPMTKPKFQQRNHAEIWATSFTMQQSIINLIWAIASLHDYGIYVRTICKHVVERIATFYHRLIHIWKHPRTNRTHRTNGAHCDYWPDNRHCFSRSRQHQIKCRNIWRTCARN